MKILIVSSMGNSMNSVRPEAEIYIALAKKGHQVTIFTQKTGSYTDIFIKNNIKVVDCVIKKKISLTLIKKIKNEIKTEGVELVYATKSKEISNSIFACIGTKAKLVTYRGTAGGLYRHDLSSYLNALNPRVNAIVAVSETVKKHVNKQILKKNTLVKTIYKGHNLNWYNIEPINLKELNTEEKTFNIAFIANVRKHKGLDVVLKAINHLDKEINIKLFLAGYVSEADKNNYLKILSKNSKNKVVFLGYRHDVPNILAACHALIHASLRKEGLPRIILESLALGTPVIASDISCNQEIITDNFNGALYEAGNDEMLAEKIISFYKNKDLINQLKQNTKEIFNDKLSFHKNIDKLESYFEDILLSK